jgi:hypothetical protein
MDCDLVFTCSKCGKVATRVRVLEPGEVPETQDTFWSSLTSDSRRLCIEIGGLQSWTSQRTDSPQEILRDWIAEDFLALRRGDETQVANRCFECEQWYCGRPRPMGTDRLRSTCVRLLLREGLSPRPRVHSRTLSTPGNAFVGWCRSVKRPHDAAGTSLPPMHRIAVGSTFHWWHVAVDNTISVRI